MKICVNETVREMTDEEEKAYREEIATQDESGDGDKLTVLEQQVSENAEQITEVQEALCEIYEQII